MLFFQPGLKFLSCDRLLCFNRILSLDRTEMSARETGMKLSPCGESPLARDDDFSLFFAVTE
jgi:hypothetical protein